MESSSSSLIANPVSTNSRRRKRKIKIQSQNPNDIPNQSSKIAWKSETTQQLYSSKLFHALRQVRLHSSSPSAPRGGRAVKEAADMVLATTARGRTRWSRAILTNRLRIKYLTKKRKRQRAPVTGVSRFVKNPRMKVKSLLTVERKVKTLARLVPGCRKEGLPVVLEEAIDFIPALEMQVRALREILSRFGDPRPAGEGSGSSSGAMLPDNGAV